jgi:hypothetical protein
METKLFQTTKPLDKVLLDNWSKGFTVQQSFSDIRGKNIGVTYQQVTHFHTTKNSQFDGMFASIFVS